MSHQPTLADIREQVRLKLRLDFPSDEAIATYWIQQAYTDIAQYTGFEWERTSVYGLTPGAGAFTLPGQVAWIRHLQMQYADGSISSPAQQARSEAILLLQARDTSAAASRDGVLYALQGQNDVMFWPLAGQGQTVKVLHTVIPDELEDDDTPCLQEPYGSKLLEYGALVEGAKFKKDPLMSDFELSYRMWTERYVAWLNRRRGGTSLAFEVWPGAEPVDRIEAESERSH
jgi:hypothetical protein